MQEVAVAKKFYVREIAAVNLSKIYFLKNAKKTCKPNKHDLNRDLKRRFPLLQLNFTQYRCEFSTILTMLNIYDVASYLKLTFYSRSLFLFLKNASYPFCLAQVIYLKIF